LNSSEKHGLIMSPKYAQLAIEYITLQRRLWCISIVQRTRACPTLQHVG